MKTSTTILYPNQQVADSVTAYSESRSLELPKEIADYHAWICETQENSNYTISTFQAKSLVFLARLVRAKRGKCLIIARYSQLRSLPLLVSQPRADCLPIIT